MSFPNPRFRCYDKQREFVQSRARFKGFCAGRGAGKSEAGAMDVLTQSIRRSGLYLVGAPTYQSLHDYTIRSFKKVLQSQGLWQDAWYRSSYSAPSYKAPWAEFIFRSADNPERFRGPNLSGGWLDEASQYEEAAWDNFIACVRDGDYLGNVCATFTPKGASHWTRRVFGTERPNTFFVHAKSNENPFISPQFYADLLDQYGEHSRTARQELGGEFLDVEGAEWPGELFSGEDLWYDEIHPSLIAASTIAVDPAKGMGETGCFSAIVWLARGHQIQGGPTPKMYVDADLAQTRSAEAIVDLTMDWAVERKPDAVTYEGNGFQYLFKTLHERKARERGVMSGVNTIDNRVDKDVRIRRLGAYLERREFRFKRNRGTRLLFEQLRDFPVHDYKDGPDALECGLRSLITIVNGRAKAGRR
jgi:Phage terminase large subunit